MKIKINKIILTCIMAALMIFASACSGSDNDGATSGEAPKISGLTYESTMKLDYAECFDVYKYSDGFSLIDVHDDAKYLVVPEGKEVPDNLDKDMVILKQPVDNIYVAATASMALFDSMDALDMISMSSLKADGWTVENAKKAMENGEIIYAGKYNEPDYELILDKECNLAVESTMIYHTPNVKEMIEELGIPVFIDRSSYESNPLGRSEWIKLYGVITGHEKKANEFFDSQKEVINKLKDFKSTGKKVAFFYVTTDGKVVVRSSKDYISTMISMAGGEYVFTGLEDKDGKSSISMTMEDFYKDAVDADYIVYNGSIDSSVKKLKDLEAKDEVFKNFKAVKEGKCYATGNSMYQRTDIIANMIMDFHKILTEEKPSDLQFLTKLE